MDKQDRPKSWRSDPVPSALQVRPDGTAELQLKIVFDNSGRSVQIVESADPSVSEVQTLSELISSTKPQNIAESIGKILRIADFHSTEYYEWTIDAIHQNLLKVNNKVPTICYMKILEAIRAQNRQHLFEAIERKLEFSSKMFIYLLRRRINPGFIDDVSYGGDKKPKTVSAVEQSALPRRLYRIYCFLMDQFLLKFIPGGPVLACLTALEGEISTGRGDLLPLLKLLLGQTTKPFIEKYPDYMRRLSKMCKDSPIEESAVEVTEPESEEHASLRTFEEHLLWIKVNVSLPFLFPSRRFHCW